MDTSEVQKEADTAGRMGFAFGTAAMCLAVLFGWLLAHLSSNGPETRPVVVAAQAIDALSTPKIEQLRVVDWPTAALPKGTFQKPEDVIKTGKLNISGLFEGEPVIEARLSNPDRGLGMSQVVEANKRAFVVQIQESVATAEIMHPGALVDVVATLMDNKTHEMVTKTIVQNVQVVAVGDSIDVERSEKSTDKNEDESHSERVSRHRVVTLMVAPQDAELLTFASHYGQIDLTLRNNNDSASITTQGVSMDKIMGRKKSDDRAGQNAGASNEADMVPVSPVPPPHLPQHSRGRSASTPKGPSIIKIGH